MVIMKYVVLKNSLSFLCVQLPEGFGTKLEIVCFESQAEFDEYLQENKTALCQISFAQPVQEKGEAPGSFPFQDGLYVYDDGYYVKLLFSEILWIEAARSYCCIQAVGKKNYIVTYPLAEVKKKLPSAIFIQPHRSYLVNMNRIDKFIGNVLYIGDKSIPISRKLKKEVLDLFSFLDNIKDTLGKDILPFGKQNLPLGKKIGKKNGNNVNLNNDDEDESSGKDK